LERLSAGWQEAILFADETFPTNAAVRIALVGTRQPKGLEHFAGLLATVGANVNFDDAFFSVPPSGGADGNEVGGVAPIANRLIERFRVVLRGQNFGDSERRVEIFRVLTANLREKRQRFLRFSGETESASPNERTFFLRRFRNMRILRGLTGFWRVELGEGAVSDFDLRVARRFFGEH
jgi:hypothetical protein